MAAARRLDPNAKRAVTVAVIVLLAVPVLALRGVMSTRDEPIVASSDQDDRVMFVGGHTMLLERGSLGRKIADWLKLNATDTRTFEIGDQTFAPNSAQLTPGGWSQLARFSQMMKGHPVLNARILVSANSADAPVRRLEEMRARRLRDAIVAQGVPESRVSALDDPAAAPMAETHAPADGNPHLLVLLSKT